MDDDRSVGSLDARPSGPSHWAVAFSIGILLRLPLTLPLLTGYAGGPLLLVGAIVLHVAIAIGVLLGSRIVLAFGIYGSLTGLSAVVLGPSVGWPLVWIAVDAAYALALAGMGIFAWRALPRRTTG